MSFNINEIYNYRPSLPTVENNAIVERATGEWVKTGHLSPKLIKSLKKTSIITSSGSSTRIENALMSDEEIKRFIDGGKVITDLSSRSEREVAGYIEALEYIYGKGSDDPVSEHSIKSFHQLMTRNFTNKMIPLEQRGVYKNIPNDVIEKNEETGGERTWFETTPPGPQTEAAMAELIEKYHALLSEEIPKLIIIGWFIVHFLAIHPFRDGNGRISRLLTTWLMGKNGYTWIPYSSHEKFIEDNKDRYYVSLRQTQQSFRSERIDYDPWLSFFGLILSKQALFLQEKVLKKSTEINSMEYKLNKNERVVVKSLQAEEELSRVNLMAIAEMSDKGMKQLLKRLVENQIIETKGKGKNTVYLIKGTEE